MSILVIDESYPLLDYLSGLHQTNYDCFTSVIAQLTNLQDSRYLRPPTVRPLKGGKAAGIFELRVKGNQTTYARIPLIYNPFVRREIILLFGETKKGKAPSASFIKQSVNYRNKINAMEASYESFDPNITNDWS